MGSPTVSGRLFVGLVYGRARYGVAAKLATRFLLGEVGKDTDPPIDLVVLRRASQLPCWCPIG